jgi:hypothetical protein
MTFADVLQWLEGSMGRRVTASVAARKDAASATTLLLDGELKPGTRRWMLADPPLDGEVASYEVGSSGGLMLAAWEFEAAEPVEGDDWLLVEFESLQLSLLRH